MVKNHKNLLYKIFIHLTRVTSIAALAFICVSALFFVKAYANQHSIPSYRTEVKVNIDNSYNITESFKIIITENASAITRYIPLRTYNGAPAEVSEIKIEGYNFTYENDEGFCKIIIDDEKLSSKSAQVIKLSYKYTIGDDRNTAKDEFFLDLTGNRWNCKISELTFDVTFPASFGDKKIYFTKGFNENLGKKHVLHTSDGYRIIGKTLIPLEPFENFTIKIPLDESYFKTEKITTLADEIIEHKTIFFFLAVLQCVLCCFFNGINRRHIPALMFYPPENLTPSDVGYIIDCYISTHDILCILAFWANKGYLKISVSKDANATNLSFMLVKFPRNEEEKPHELYLFEKIFEGIEIGESISSVDIAEKLSSEIRTISKMFKHYYTKKSENDRIFRKKNYIVRGLGYFSIYILSALGAIIATHQQFIYYYNEGLVINAFASLLITVSLLLISTSLLSWQLASTSTRLKSLLPKLIVGTISLILYHYVGYKLSIASDVFSQLIICNLVAFVLSILLSYSATSRTDKGMKLFDELLGFRHFIKNADSDTIEMLLENDSKYFFNVLPYVMVLGLNKKGKFAKLFSDYDLSAPTWLISETTDTALLATELCNAFIELSQLIDKPPIYKEESLNE